MTDTLFKWCDGCLSAHACAMMGRCSVPPLAAQRGHSGDGGEEFTPNTMAGFVGGFRALNKRNPTHQELWDAAVKSAINRYSAAAPQDGDCTCGATGNVVHDEACPVTHMVRAAFAESGESANAAPTASSKEAYDLQFPVALRKMWAGWEVQKWLDDLPPLYTHPGAVQPSRAEVLLKLRAAQMCHPNAVQPLIEEAIDLLEDKS